MLYSNIALVFTIFEVEVTASSNGFCTGHHATGRDGLELG
jgi:hypothetical protein